MPATTHGRYRLGSGTKTSSTPCATPSWHRIGSRTFGVDAAGNAGMHVGSTPMMVPCDDHRDLPANQLGRKVGESSHLFGPAVVDRYVLALDVAGFFEALAKSAQPLGNRFGRSDLEKPDYRRRRLLHARRKRPRDRAAERG